MPVHHITTFEFNVGGLKRLEYDHEVALHMRHVLMSLLQKEIRLRITLDGLKRQLLEKTQLNFSALFNTIDVYDQQVMDPDK